MTGASRPELKQPVMESEANLGKTNMTCETTSLNETSTSGVLPHGGTAAFCSGVLVLLLIEIAVRLAHWFGRRKPRSIDAASQTEYGDDGLPDISPAMSDVSAAELSAAATTLLAELEEMNSAVKGDEQEPGQRQLPEMQGRHLGELLECEAVFSSSAAEGAATNLAPTEMSGVTNLAATELSGIEMAAPELIPNECTHESAVPPPNMGARVLFECSVVDCRAVALAVATAFSATAGDRGGVAAAAATLLSTDVQGMTGAELQEFVGRVEVELETATAALLRKQTPPTPVAAAVAAPAVAEPAAVQPAAAVCEPATAKATSSEPAVDSAAAVAATEPTPTTPQAKAAPSRSLSAATTPPLAAATSSGSQTGCMASPHAASVGPSADLAASAAGASGPDVVSPQKPRAAGQREPHSPLAYAGLLLGTAIVGTAVIASRHRR